MNRLDCGLRLDVSLKLQEIQNVFVSAESFSQV